MCAAKVKSVQKLGVTYSPPCLVVQFKGFNGSLYHRIIKFKRINWEMGKEKVAMEIIKEHASCLSGSLVGKEQVISVVGMLMDNWGKERKSAVKKPIVSEAANNNTTGNFKAGSEVAVGATRTRRSKGPLAKALGATTRAPGVAVALEKEVELETEKKEEKEEEKGKKGGQADEAVVRAQNKSQAAVAAIETKTKKNEESAVAASSGNAVANAAATKLQEKDEVEATGNQQDQPNYFLSDDSYSFDDSFEEDISEEEDQGGEGGEGAGSDIIGEKGEKGKCADDAEEAEAKVVVATTSKDLPVYGNLNKASDAELDAAKGKMDKLFEANRIRKGDEGFEWDKRVDFEEGDEESSWD